MSTKSDLSMDELNTKNTTSEFPGVPEEVIKNLELIAPQTIEALSDKDCVHVESVSKLYKIYQRPVDRLKELLSFENKRYHREFWALNDITIKFPKGKLTTLLGPNGSGKSTLLQIIAGTLQATSGQVRKNGRVTAILELGAGFQHEHTGRENIMLYGLLLGISQEEMQAHMPGILEFAEIGDFIDQPIKTYSSGMVIRLAYACATAVQPDILIVDEALAVGDIRFQQKCFAKIDDILARGTTVILVTHDLAAARQAHYSVLLHQGRVLMQGFPENVIPEYRKLMDCTIPQ